MEKEQKKTKESDYLLFPVATKTDILFVSLKHWFTVSSCMYCNSKAVQ